MRVRRPQLVLARKRAVRVFYDLDTPVTLARLAAGERSSYIGPRGLADFDLVLSYTGGGALTAARAAGRAPGGAALRLVDPAVHRRRPPRAYRADLSYLGTYAADRQAALEELFIGRPRAAGRTHASCSAARGYPTRLPLDGQHLLRPPPRRPASTPRSTAPRRLTLNVTRAAMAAMGYCPSGRLFEAAACGAAGPERRWAGLDALLRARERNPARASDRETSRGPAAAATASCGASAAAARERALAEHTAAHRRASELVDARSECGARSRREPPARRA